MKVNTNDHNEEKEIFHKNVNLDHMKIITRSAKLPSAQNNGLTPNSRGRGSNQGCEKLRRPYETPQVNPAAGDTLQSPVCVRPNTSSMPNSFAAVVAGGNAAGGDSNSRPKNFKPTNELVDSVNCSPMPHPQTPVGGSQMHQFSLSPYAKEFIPRTLLLTQPDEQNVEETNVDSQVDEIIGFLREFFYEVTLNPGKFDRSVSNVVQNLNQMINDEACLSAIVNTLFEQAIVEPNFRYNAARLCKQLCNSCHFKNTSFRHVLLDKCALFFGNRESEMMSDPAKLRGFTFFMGELYSQIKVNEQRIDVLSNALPALFETLMCNSNSENYKCVCQMMKFTGPDLEDDERSRLQSTPTMDKLINILESSLNNAPRDVQGMMSSVVRLRECNWGRAVSPPVSNNEPLLTEDIPTEAVFYGPDGQPLTAEEALFLETSTQDAYNEIQYDEYEDPDDDDSEGMDEEIAAAYEEFLRHSGQQ